MNKRTEVIERALTPEEQRIAGLALARKHAEMDRLLAEKSAALAQFKERKLDIESAMKALSDQANHARIQEEVEVQDERNDAEGKMETIRLDTGEVVLSRPFTAEEKQSNLFPLRSAAEQDRVDSSPAAD